ncbi:MAG: 23S rRNA (guanosine(2251)-2'-O)-methyltransferase RlmB [Clostridia bacterium]|nr:23S rRNA (guanosine(2251)-2'-O)-methyltransferase RlmB [Clostridia bacterium]
MRESYRDKRNRQARIAKERVENEERRKEQRRKSDRRVEERRQADRRVSERRKTDRNELDRRIGERRSETDRRFVERRSFEDRRQNDEDGNYEDIVAGRNAVMELLKSEKDINKLYIEHGERHGSINEIIAKAKEARVVLVEVDKSKLDQMAENHQGVVAVVPPFNYSEVEDILECANEKGEAPFILILDGIEDPHNFGSIIRTAETAGVHGIIIPKRRNVQVNSTVVKVSTGATSYVKIARVNNLNDTIRKLKDAGLWVIGTDGDANTMYYNQDLKGPLAIIIGSEGYGMSKLVKENADILIKIPMKGQITSLNASVSAGIVIYEAVKQRM